MQYHPGKATDEQITEPDWMGMMAMCDLVRQQEVQKTNAECLWHFFSLIKLWLTLDIQPKLGGVLKIQFNFAQKRVHFGLFHHYIICMVTLN